MGDLHRGEELQKEISITYYAFTILYKSTIFKHVASHRQLLAYTGGDLCFNRILIRRRPQELNQGLVGQLHPNYVLLKQTKHVCDSLAMVFNWLSNKVFSSLKRIALSSSLSHLDVSRCQTHDDLLSHQEQEVLVVDAGKQSLNMRQHTI